MNDTTTSHAEAAEQNADYEDAVKRRTLVVTILGAGLVFLDSSIANVSLPAIQRDLGITTAEQQWVVSAYLLTLSTLLLVGGRLADIYGRVRLFRAGAATYVLFALGAVFAPSGPTLIAARAAQGVAGALLVPTTLAILNSVFPPKERGKAIGTWAAWSGITTILGPIVGGFVIDNVSWRFAFLISPLLALTALVLARAVPESTDEAAEKGIDFLGVGLVVVALGGIVYGLIQAPAAGWGSPGVWAPLAVGAVVLPIFLWWESRARSPVMPYAMFSNHNLAVANLVTFFVYAGLYGMFFYAPLYLQSALGASATLSASVFIPITVLLFFLSPVAGRLNDRFGPRWLMTGGPAVAALGLVVVSFTGPGQLWTVMLPGIVLFGVGLGFTVTPVTATAIGSAEQRYSGIASGFNNGVSRVAGLVAIALMGLIVVQLWQAGLSAAAVGAGPQAVAAIDAVRGKAFVTPETEGLDRAASREVAQVTRRASMDAFRNGTLLAALLVAAGGIVSALWIRSPDRDVQPRAEGRASRRRRATPA